jgi:hypothetical protein
MLKTVGKSRTACIAMDDGTLSPSFKLESGRPQGEILSPVQYNIGNHILLLRIELDPGIKSLFNKILGPNTPFMIHVNNLDENKFFRHESERETDKAEGFADDGNIITLADQESISCVENILVDFASVSGLECNFEKSSIMYFGPDAIPNIVTNFPTQKSVNLLGFDIDSEAASLQSNFLKVKKRLVAIANFWDRFSLSLPGRIQIAKTFMLSQVNYFGSIIFPDPENLKWMQSLIDNFCLKNLNVSKTKLYLLPSSGGLGLIKLSDTLQGQQTIWFKKASYSTRDNWRWDLWKIGTGNCFTVPPLDTVEHPILSTLTESFRSFLKKFYLKDANILEAYVLNNPLITLDNGFLYDLDARFWTAAGNTNIFNISQLKIKDFYSEGKIKSVVQLCIKNSGSDKTIQVQRQLCQLPVSLTSFEKKTFVSDNWADIFESVLPLSSGSEQQIIDSLIAEINNNFSCNLATEIDFSRSVSNPPPWKEYRNCGGGQPRPSSGPSS